MSEVPPEPGEAEEPTGSPVAPDTPGSPVADAGGGDDGDFESIVAGLDPAGAPGSPDDGGPMVPPADVSVEALLDDIERLTGERDDYLNRLRRAQADFENSKKRLQRDAGSRADAVTGRLVEDLLPVLDACDGAIAHGEAAVEPVFAALVQILEKNGLERIDPAGDVFDPTRHEAVMHEPASDDDDPALSVVADVLRIGYAWKGRVVRAAMVKVRG
ncbi:nucleotide exchange factor GrpE [Iamia sp.]|uniref:nucleotide exchange factor GrpE n=1 Tax=Iamia sp. TaxID=2722710 RepID=UPI002CE20C28|nr:nucleotide exchange factor GrpE [Iamia sp.]HXH57515.1 nucleotide exchange factor GrpE [Iamia sp.]